MNTATHQGGPKVTLTLNFKEQSPAIRLTTLKLMNCQGQVFVCRKSRERIPEESQPLPLSNKVLVPYQDQVRTAKKMCKLSVIPRRREPFKWGKEKRNAAVIGDNIRE